MNGTNSTHFGTMIRMFFLVAVLISGTNTATMAQTPSCACKGAIQVSVDEGCDALVTADMILANGSTCGGTTSSVVTLMKTPTGGVITQGVGSTTLDGSLYIGKTIYGKVATSDGLNSCWTTIKVEDKFKPTWESLVPDTLVVTCPALGSYIPTAFDNCHTPRVYQVSERIVVNDCINPIFLGSDTLKMIERKFRAIDESGNISDTDCSVVYWVVALDVDDVIGVQNKELECDAKYAKIPAGKPFAGHPSPTDITISTSPLVVYPGSGVPSLYAWMPATRGAGTVDINPINGNLRLNGGTAPTVFPGMGAQVCVTAIADGNIGFDWTAIMKGSTPPAGNFILDHAQYNVNGGSWTNLTAFGPGNVQQGGSVGPIAILKDQQFCFRVFTENLNRWTELMVSNFTGPIPANISLTPENADHCNIYVSYEDTKFPTIKCVTKIMRKWQVLEWSCDSKVREFYQIIEIIDKKGPVISDLKEYDTASTNGHSCEGIYKLQKPTLVDNCSTNLTYDVTVYDASGNAVSFKKGLKTTDSDSYIELPIGCVSVVYTAFDECHNQTEHEINVIVEDNTAPVVICDQNTTIGLTQDGKAWVPATAFDDGSYDDCELAKMLVRRMNPEVCKPCKTPEFPGFTYLGDYNVDANGTKHYYYISKHRANPRVAIKTAEAMGGYVTAINTANEDAWLYGKVQEWNLDEDYLIGLRDLKKKGIYSWLSGESSTYRNWNTPTTIAQIGNNPYDYVRVSDDNGKWDAFGSEGCDQDEWLYVVEITDPCGFSSYAQFCCSDVGPTSHMVQFRVIDKSGNWNDCMVNALIQDKLPPTIACPPHMTITCNDYFDTDNLRGAFGWPTVFDNCENPRITQDSVIDLNSCRIGTITRTFTATDAGGRSAKCTQIIHVEGLKFPFVMVEDRWPRDTTMQGCENPNDDAFGPDFLGKPDLTADNICSLVGADYDDQIFYFNNNSGESCFKILRHWTVIDWCQRREVLGGGYEYATWTHTQIIKVYDPEKPVITSSCAPKSVCTYDPTCKDGYIELIASATDECTDQLRYSYKIDLDNNKVFEYLQDGSFDPRYSKSGLATTVTTSRVNTVDASGTYPIGFHRIEWSFEDRCGNVTKCEQLFTIANCKAPTPYCINGLATSLMPMDTNNDGTPDAGMVDIWAKDFDNGSSHPCGYPVLLSFAPITLDANNKPVLTPGRTYTCDSLGRRNVNLYVGVQTPMGTIVQDFCTTFITIQDNFDVCDGDQGRFVVQGSLMTESDAPVSGVNVDLVGGEMNMLTGNTGLYNFAEVLQGGNYFVKAGKNDDHLNGVSTLDLVMIQRHILGLDKLKSPYKLIAADVTNDKKITASDLTELRKLILGVVNGFSNNESWKFIDKSYNFIDAQTAHTESIPLVYNIEGITEDMEVNFMAVKIGDVNGNVVANANDNLIENRSAASLMLVSENQAFTAGQVINVPVQVSEDASVAGFQFTVNFDTELFSLEAVNGGLAGMTDYNFGFTELANGLITVSYNRENNIEMTQGDNIFILTLRAKDKGVLSQGLWIDSAITKAEAYTQDYSVMKVDFSVSNRVAESVVLYQNTPNPFKAVTSIGFDLPETMEATVTIYDVTGKSLKVIRNTFNKGYNSIELNKNELGSAGVLYYTLEAGDFKATKKMVVIE